jgi:hypothetical protein
MFDSEHQAHDKADQPAADQNLNHPALEPKQCNAAVRWIVA